MARIGVDARYLENERTGLGRYSYNLLHHLLQVDRENQYTVFLRESYKGGLPGASNVTYFRVPHLPISIGSLVSMSLRIRRLKPHLWHAHFPVLPLSHRVPSVITVHDLQPLRVPALSARRPLPLRMAYRIYYPLVYRHALRRARAVVAVSQATAREIQELCRTPSEKIRVIYEAPDDRFVETGSAGRDGEGLGKPCCLPERFLLYVGATLPHKNLGNMIRGFAKALRDHKIGDCFLVLAGRESRFEQDWLELARRLDVSHRMVRLGYVQEKELADLYRRAEALLYVTCFEGFGFPPLEAMLHGLPVIAAHHAALPEVVGSGGLCVIPTDVDAIAEAIARMLRDSDLRERLRGFGKRNLERFSWRKAAQETLCLFERVLAEV